MPTDNPKIRFQSRNWDYEVFDRRLLDNSQLLGEFQSRNWDYEVFDPKNKRRLDGLTDMFQSRNWDYEVFDFPGSSGFILVREVSVP